MEDNVEKNTPGPAIGSLIVIVILIVGAIYMLVTQLNKTSAPVEPENDITPQATSTI